MLCCVIPALVLPHIFITVRILPLPTTSSSIHLSVLIPSDNHWIAVFCLACRSFLLFFLPLSVAPSKKPFFISPLLPISDGLLFFFFFLGIILLLLLGISPRPSRRFLPHARDHRLVASFTVLYILLLWPSLERSCNFSIFLVFPVPRPQVVSLSPQPCLVSPKLL